MIRIAHISDLHISKILFSLGQFFSKRWLGNLNLLLSRRKQFQQTQLWDLIEVLKQKKVDYLFVTGDITSTSHPKEFELATALFQTIRSHGIITIFTPGNHDVYTKESEKIKRFYQYFKNPKPYTPSQLKTDRVEAHKIFPHWWYVVCDTSIATSLISSRGYFCKTLENNLKQSLLSIPKEDNIILGTHFPFSQEGSARKILVRGAALESLLKEHQNIKIFLHGHTHQNRIILPQNHLPLILDSGSSSHNTLGSWNLLSFSDSSCEIDVFRWQNTKKPQGRWSIDQSEKIEWEPSHE